MLRVSICDDDVATLSQLEELVRQYLDPGELCLATYSGYGEFLTTRQYVDLLFMDIDLGDGCGIELAKEVKKTDSGTCVIFVTAHPEYVEESFEVEPVYFLVKPIRPDSFRRAMDRAMERLVAERQKSRLTVTFQNRVSAVALRDISYIEFSVRSATIHAGTRVLRTYEKLSSLQQRVDSRQAELEAFEASQAQQFAHYQQTAAHLHQVRLVRHDIYNYIQAALYLSRDGTPQSREKAMHLIEQVYTALDSQEDSHEL